MQSVLRHADAASCAQQVRSNRRNARPSLAYARPKGRFRGTDTKSTDALLEHGFTFNRLARLRDLGDITPKEPDAFDQQHYCEERGYWRARANKRFILADLQRVDAPSLLAMLALDVRLVMRVQITLPTDSVRPLSITLTRDHTWALRGWVESAARKEIPKYNNAVVHIDDHPDLQGLHRRPVCSCLKKETVEDLIADHVCSVLDPLGIGSFIAPAAQLGLISSLYWIYGTKRTEEAKERYVREKAWLEKCPDPNTRRRMRWEIIPHSDRPDYRFDPGIRFPGLVHGFRSDNIPWRSLSGTGSRSQASGRILDIDLDVQDELDDFESVVQPFIDRIDLFHAITIAVSPQFGAQLNHLEKVLSLLQMIREAIRMRS